MKLEFLSFYLSEEDDFHVLAAKLKGISVPFARSHSWSQQNSAGAQDATMMG